MNSRRSEPERIRVVLPTLNERDNIISLCDEILRVISDVEIVVIDDSSSDGTGDVVQAYAVTHPSVRLVTRPGRLGIGSAHDLALREAHDDEIDVLVTMDADWTHQPSDIPRLIDKLDDAVVVVGSRFAKDGGLLDWAIFRKLLTHTGHLMTQMLLQIPYDSTGALRAYRVSAVVGHLSGNPLSSGYPWLYESLSLLHQSGVPIAEVPIVLTKRAYGSSKMRVRDVILGATNLCVFSLRLRRRHRGRRS
jgi:dolichol-phosphate mannosyltransferase